MPLAKLTRPALSSLSPAAQKDREKEQHRAAKQKARELAEAEGIPFEDSSDEENWKLAETPPTPPSVTSSECRELCASAATDGFFAAAKLRLLNRPRWRRIFLAAARRFELRLDRQQEAMFLAAALDDLDGLEELSKSIPPQLFAWWSYEFDIYMRAVRRCRPDMLQILPPMKGSSFPTQFKMAQIREAMVFKPKPGSPSDVQRKQHGELVIKVVREAMERKTAIDSLALKDALDDPIGGQWRVSGSPRSLQRKPVTAAGVNIPVASGEFRGWRALHFVAANVHAGHTAVDAAELLFEAKADATLKDASGGTCLHTACLLGNNKVVNILLMFGAPVEDLDIEGCSALMVAARTGNGDLVKQIINWTVLDFRQEMLQVAEKLDARYTRARSQELLKMVTGNDVVAVKRLLMEGDGTGLDLADVHFADAQGRACAHHAIRGVMGEDQCCAMLRLIVSLKGEINSADYQGTTPLHYAAQLGRHEVATALLKLKAHPGLTDKQGRTPLMVAAAARDDDSRDPPPYNGRICNTGDKAYGWKTIEGILKWNGLGGQPSGLLLRKPGPPEPGKVDPRAAFHSPKKKKQENLEEEGEEGGGEEVAEQQFEGEEEESPKGEKDLPELDKAKQRTNILAQMGWDDQDIMDSDGMVNRGDKLQFHRHIHVAAGNRVHGIDALMVPPEKKHLLRPVEKRCSVLYNCLVGPLLQLKLQYRLDKKQEDFLDYCLYSLLGKRGRVFGVLVMATTVKPYIPQPFWNDIKEALEDYDDLEDRVDAFRVLGFRGPKPRKQSWVGAAWAVDEYPRNPDAAPWTAFQYVDRETAYVLGQGQPGLHGEAFKGNRLWCMENLDPLDKKERDWEAGMVKKENEFVWEAAPSFNWSGAVDKLPAANRFDKIQLQNRLFIDEATFQRKISEERVQLVGEKLLCPLLVESAKSLARPNVGAWTDGENLDDEYESELMATYRDLLRYIAAQVSAYAGRTISGLHSMEGLEKLRRPYKEVFEQTQETLALALQEPATPELGELTSTGVVIVPFKQTVASKGAKRSQFEPKETPTEQAELIPESETRWFRFRQSAAGYVILRLCSACSCSRDYMDMVAALNRQQPKSFAPAFWMASYGMMLWGRGRQLRPSLDLAIRRRLFHARFEEEDEEESSEEEEMEEDNEEEGEEAGPRPVKEKPVPQFIMNGPRLVTIAEVLRLDWAAGPAGAPSEKVPCKPGEQPLPVGPAGMLRTEIVCRNPKSLIAAFKALTGPPPPEVGPTVKDEWDDDFMLEESEDEDEEGEKKDDDDEDSDEESEEESKAGSKTGSKAGSKGSKDSDDEEGEEEDMGPLTGARAEVRAKRRAPIGKPANLKVVKIVNGFHPDQKDVSFPQAAGILLLMHISARKSRKADRGHGEKEVDSQMPLVDESDLVQQLVEVELLLDSSMEGRWLQNFSQIDPTWLGKKRDRERQAAMAAEEAARRMKQKLPGT